MNGVITMLKLLKNLRIVFSQSGGGLRSRQMQTHLQREEARAIEAIFGHPMSGVGYEERSLYRMIS